MRTVYRLEMPNGEGIYRGRDGPCAYVVNDGPERHPTPNNDGGMSRDWDRLGFAERESYFFGFASEEQLYNWFYRDEWRDMMMGHGVVLRLFTVPDNSVIDGYTQVAFRKDRATLIETREQY